LVVGQVDVETAQGSAIYYVDAIAEVLVNNEARASAIGGADPCFLVDKITTMRGRFFCCESSRHTKSLFDGVNFSRKAEVSW